MTSVRALAAAAVFALSTLLVLHTASPAQAVSSLNGTAVPGNAFILTESVTGGVAAGTVPTTAVTGGTAGANVAVGMAPVSTSATTAGIATGVTGTPNGLLGVGGGILAVVGGVLGFDIDFGTDPVLPEAPAEDQAAHSSASYFTEPDTNCSVSEQSWCKWQNAKIFVPKCTVPGSGYPRSGGGCTVHHEFSSTTNISLRVHHHAGATNSTAPQHHTTINTILSGSWVTVRYRCDSTKPETGWVYSGSGNHHNRPPCGGEISSLSSAGGLFPQTAGFATGAAWKIPPVGVHSIEQTITCKRASDGTTYTRSNTENVGNAPTGVQSVVGLMCDAPDVMKEFDAGIKTAGLTSAETVPLVDHLATPPWVEDIPVTCRATNVVCELQLLYKATPTTWASCHSSPSPCAGWMTSAAYPGSFQCRYGNAANGVPYVTKALRLCEVYENIGTEGVLKPTPAEVITSPVPVPDPPDNGGCSLGFGDVLNGSVFYKAITCALKWAFVPSPEQMSGHIDTVRGGFNSSGLGASWSEGFQPFFTAIGGLNPGTGTCQGPALNLPTVGSFDQPTMYPLNACEQPIQRVAIICNVALSFGIVFAACITALKSVSYGFGYKVALRGGVK